jgi:hypothetical protein
MTSDCKIWNKEQFVIDVIKEGMVTDGVICIALNAEGPCCKETHIDAVLSDIASTFDISADRFVINTANQIRSSRYKEIRWINDILTGAHQKIKSYIPVKSTLKKTFGIFIGRSNWQRLGIASYIWNTQKDNSVMTFHYDPRVEYHRSNVGLEELLCKYPDGLGDVFPFLGVLPLTHDTVSYPILWSDNAYDLDALYDDIFCEIVCETYFSGRTFFISEKTYRCIVNKRPFIVQGPKWFLKNLRKLGFKTFSKWWDEGYDEDHSDSRFETLTHHVDWIGSQNEQTISNWYQEMQSTLEHNYNTLRNLTNEQILDTEFYYE